MGCEREAAWLSLRRRLLPYLCHGDSEELSAVLPGGSADKVEGAFRAEGPDHALALLFLWSRLPSGYAHWNSVYSELPDSWDTSPGEHWLGRV